MLLAAFAAGAAVVLAGGSALLLGGDDAPATPSAAAPRATADASPTQAAAGALPPADVELPPADVELSPAVVRATAADRTPADARAALGEQLAARADANLGLLRSTWEGDRAAADRAAAAVAASSTGMSAVVTAWRDTALADELEAGLDRQSEASQAYAAAVASGDVDAADRARAEMAEVSRELGAVLAGVTGGRIAEYVPPQDAAKYRAFVDALEAGDTRAAQEAAQWLEARLAREGAALALVLAGGSPS